MQTMLCKCGDYLKLVPTLHTEEKDNISYRYHNCSKLVCPSCKSEYLPDLAKDMFSVLEDNEECTGGDFDFEKMVDAILDDEFTYTDVDFNYNRSDYYFLPGLIRPWNKGFLTPVFMNLEVFIKYCHHPSYSIEFGANTYGNIYHDNNHIISFGINRNNKAIMWLGDIAKLPKEEQHYLRSENVKSDGDISSEFYEAQIEVTWANPSEVKKLFSKRVELHELVIEKLGFPLNNLEVETIRIVNKIIKPFLPTEQAFSDAIIPLNMLFVESLNSKAIKSDLMKNISGIETKNLKGLKLLQLWMEHRLGLTEASKLISSMFVLYDLRIFCAHLQSDESRESILESVKNRLKISNVETDYICIFDELVTEMNQLYDELINAVKKLN